MGKTLVVLVTAALLLGNAAMAAAADFCMDGPFTLVLKGFAVPGKGACKETRGFYRDDLIWVNGLACGSSDGDRITFSQTGVSDAGNVMITDKFVLDRQTLSGSGLICLVGAGTCVAQTWTKIPCTSTITPVP